ncbi:MAG: hypothetical protein ABMB14_04090, partial [Myxococcota bacterium]
MIALGWASAAIAGGFEVAQQSAVAGGTGHASTARDDDAGAAWFVPAALADDDGLRIAVGAAVASSTIRAAATDDAGWDLRSDNPLGTPPHLYASWAGHHVLVGVAANAPFAGGVRWPADSPLRFDDLETTPTFFRIAPFLGAGFGPVRIAAGPHVDVGSLFVHQATDHVTEEGDAQILLRGSGIGADLSVFVHAGPASIGLSYKSRTTLPLSGEADFDVPVAFAHQLPDQTVSSRWTLPDRLALGEVLAVGPVDVLFDQVLTVWSVNDALTIDFADPVTADVTQQNQWQDALALRLGAELGVAGIATVRAGGYVDGLGLDGRGPAIVPAET